MGQKVHPGGLRVGVIHDWKSNWYVGKKEFPKYILEDVQIRDHINSEARPRRTLRHPDPQGQQRITVDICTARTGIVIGDQAVKIDTLHRELTNPQPTTSQGVRRRRDQASRARHEADHAVDRRTACRNQSLRPR